LGPEAKKTMNYFGFNSVLEPEHRTRKFLFFWFISAQSQLAGLLFHKIRINILVLYNSVLEPEQRTRKFPILFISPQSRLAGLLFHKINYFGFIKFCSGTRTENQEVPIFCLFQHKASLLVYCSTKSSLLAYYFCTKNQHAGSHNRKDNIN